MTTVTLESKEFGLETFEYETEAEAKEGMKRLIQKASKQTIEDGIQRTISRPGYIVATIPAKNGGHLVRPDGSIKTTKATMAEEFDATTFVNGVPFSADAKDEPQHTPGPWRVESPNEYGSLICDAQKNNICHLPYANHEANAALIAAAPETARERDKLRKAVEAGSGAVADLMERNAELLEALKMVYTYAQDTDDLTLDVWTETKAAIAKAEGKP